MGYKTILSDEEAEDYVEDEPREVRDPEAADGEDEEDGEDDRQDEREKDSFIVDDVEGEEQKVRKSIDEEMKTGKRKKKKREVEENYELDDDDYELLQEANVTVFHWPKSGSKKFKRLKKVGRNDDTEEKTGFSDEDELSEGGRKGATAKEKLKCSLFGDDEEILLDVAEEYDQIEEEEDVDMGEEDEMADFIVNEEVEENGLPIRRRKSKKRILRQAPGISSSALQEGQDIFSGVDKLLIRQKPGLKARGFDDDQGAKRLEDEFEPSVLAEKYMTPKDDKIRKTDVPERIQLAEKITGSVTNEKNTTLEAKWIYEHAFGKLAVPMRKEFQYIANMDEEEVVKEIANVLQLFHDQKFEVPFIAMYRKEMCLNLLLEQNHDSVEGLDKEKKTKLKSYKALWAIQLWDRRWLLLQRRKNALKASYAKRVEEEAQRDPMKLTMLQSFSHSLDEAGSERTIDDVDAKFNLHFPPDEAEVEGHFKRPKQKSIYSICRNPGLGALSGKFGLKSEGFALNLTSMHENVDVVDDTAAPEDLAAEFCSGEFRDPQSVLKGARHMASVEISCEPSIKDFVRTIYMDHAVVTTRPNVDGNNALTPFHQYAGLKWLSNKPVCRFDDAQWLLLQKAEEEKLLQITIGLPKDVIEGRIMKEFESYYLSDGVSLAAQSWNEQRKLILKDALYCYILPGMEKEARMILSARAKSWLVQDYEMQLWKKVSVAPMQHQKSYNEECLEEDPETRIMACCWGTGKDPTTFVMLDPYGEVLDILFTSHLSIRPKNPGLSKRKENDQQRLLKFLMDHQPHTVVLGASNIRCKYLKGDICEVIKIFDQHPRELAEGSNAINVVYADEFLARIYENSRVSHDQLPTQRGIVRRAVALGRYQQNPVAMVATLCGPGKEILSWKLHMLEQFLTPDDRYEIIEQVMVTITNQVGVDINLAASHEWMFAPLQFVAGLGHRKAASVQRAILRAERVNSRKKLFALGVMERCVFMNAAGFLRVSGTGQAASDNHVMNPLDVTRIHPESYKLAKKMARDVYYEDTGNCMDDMDEEQQEMAVNYVKSNMHLLKALDIDEYARSVEQQLQANKRETLADIKIELLHGFQDWRPPYKQPTEDEEFDLLTGEDKDILAVGKILQATVRRVQNHRVICNLESGLTGLINREDLSDDIDVDPLEKIQEGSILTCRVKDITKARYCVHLTCKPSELSDDPEESGQINDPFYARNECILQSEQEKAQKEKKLAKKSFKPRMIVHPRFQNISETEAIEFLTDKDAGESIIRPNSKGPSYLTLTLKVCDGVYAHKDIVEGGKDHRDIASFLRIGKTLSIGNETFKDLDEVMKRYVDPLANNLKAVLACQKFRRGTKAEVDGALQKEKYENPSTIPYYISVSYEYPGAFMLSYIRSTNPHHEYMGLYPKGFMFRKRMLENLDNLVAYFEKHLNDLVQDSVPPSDLLRPSSGQDKGRRGRGGGRGGVWNEGGGGGGWNEGRGGGCRSEGRGGGFGRNRNEGGGRGRWNEDRGNRRGRNGGRGRGSGRASNESNFNSGRGQNSGGNNSSGNFSHEQSDGWGSRTDEWGSRSGNRIPKSPAGGGWPVSSEKNGWDKHGHDVWGSGKADEGWTSFKANDNDAWGSGKANEGWNSFKANNKDATSKDNSGSFSHRKSDVWGSKKDEWGSSSGNRIPNSPAGGGWRVSSGESGLDKHGNDSWGSGKVDEGWTSFKANDNDSGKANEGWTSFNANDNDSAKGNEGWTSFKANNNDAWGSGKANEGWKSFKANDNDATSKDNSGSFSHRKSNVWGSNTDEWGSRSGNRISDLPAGGGWPVSSVKSGWDKHGNDVWGSGKGNEGLNSFKENDNDTWGSGKANEGLNSFKASDNDAWGSGKASEGWTSFKANDNDAWGSSKANEGCNSFKENDNDSTSKDNSGGWGSVDKSVDDIMAGSSNVGRKAQDTGKNPASWSNAGNWRDRLKGNNDRQNSNKASNENNSKRADALSENDVPMSSSGWDAVEASNSDANSTAVERGNGNDGGHDWTKQTDGWGSAAGGVHTNVGGSGWGS